MATITCRIELNNHDDGDYDLLHDEMKQRGFNRAFKDSGQNWWDLPPGTYSGTGMTIEKGKENAELAINKVIAKSPRSKQGEVKDYELILVITTVSRLWKLKANTDKNKRPS